MEHSHARTLQGENKMVTLIFIVKDHRCQVTLAAKDIEWLKVELQKTYPDIIFEEEIVL